MAELKTFYAENGLQLIPDRIFFFPVLRVETFQLELLCFLCISHNVFPCAILNAIVLVSSFDLPSITLPKAVKCIGSVCDRANCEAFLLPSVSYDASHLSLAMSSLTADC